VLTLPGTEREVRAGREAEGGRDGEGSKKGGEKRGSGGGGGGETESWENGRRPAFRAARQACSTDHSMP
jgi:hypothetical protein